MNNSLFFIFMQRPFIKEGVLFFLFVFIPFHNFSQPQNIHWLSLQLNDSISLKTPVIINNHHVQIPAYTHALSVTTNYNEIKDSIIFSMPVHENKMLLKKINHQNFYGKWIKYSGTKQYVLPCKIYPFNPILPTNIDLLKQFPHQWKFNIYTEKNNYTGIGIFKFYDDFQMPYLSGSIATPYGDLGNLNGYIQHDSLYLSVFNGAFATQVIGKIFYSSFNKIDSLVGYIYYGNWGFEKFSAIPDSSNHLKNEVNLSDIFTDEKFVFKHQWKDIYNNNVMIQENKPIILLLMGTWCPNCTDENKLFAEWYKNISDKVQIIALAVERHQNKNKSIEILQKYQQKLNIPYPIVLLSEKGNVTPFEIFPEIKKIPAFPTTIYFDKQHKPVKASMGFSGPATNELYLHTQQYILSNIQQISQ